MTTIAFKDGEICYESYISQGEYISDFDAVKKKKIEGVIFVFSGSTDGEENLINAYLDKGYEKKNGTAALVIDKGGVFEVGIDSNGFWKCSRNKHAAIGSGAEYAIGAMDAGATAYEAVKIAINRDVYSGGRIRRVKVK